MEKDLKIRISIDKKTGELKVVNGEFKQIRKSVKNTSASIDSFGSLLMNIGVKVGGIYLVKEAFDAVLKSGFAFNKNMEDSIAGLTALIVATSSNTSAMGKHLSIAEKYNLAQKEAIKTAQELLKINAQTPYTLNQTTEVYRSLYVTMKKAGASNEDMINLTKKLSIAAAAGGVQYRELLAGVDGIASGTVLANSNLGRFLASLGLTNAALKKTKNVVKLVEDRLSQIKSLDTMTVALSNLDNAWQQLTGTMTKTTFKSAKDNLKLLSGILTTLNTELKDYLANVDSVYDIYKITSIKVASRELEQLKDKYRQLKEGGKSWLNSTTNYNAELIHEAFLIKSLTRKIDRMKKSKDKLKKQDSIKDNKKAMLSQLSKESKLAKKINSLLTAQMPIRERIQSKYIDYANLVNKTFQGEAAKQVQLHKLDMWRANELAKSQQESYNLYASIMGTGYDKWVQGVSDKMAQLAQSGVFTNKQLQSVWETMQQDYSIDFTVKGLDDSLAKMNSMLDAQISLAQSGMNWGNSLTGVAKGIANISKSLTKLDVGKLKYNKADIKLQNDYAKAWLKLDKQRLPAGEKLIKQKALENKFTKDSKTLNQSKFNSELQGYSELAGAIGNMAGAGTQAAAAMQVAQVALAVTQGVSAIMNQGSGDPYTAIPRMAAMAVMVGTTLAQAGIAFKGAASTDFSKTMTNPNSTTVFGGGDKVSESISKAVNNISDYAKPQYKAILNMANSLNSLNSNLTGLSADIVRNGEYGVGVGSVNYQKSYKNDLPFSKIGTALGAIVGHNPLGTLISSTIGSISGLLDKGLRLIGLGGGGYNWSKLQDSGIAFGSANGVGDGTVRTSGEGYYGGTSSQAKFTAQTLDELIKSMKGLQFQTQSFESMRKSWWGGVHYSYSSKTAYKGLGSELSNSISQIFKNIKDTTLQEADIFGKDIKNKLGNFKIDIGNINLKGLKGEDIEDKINKTFSTEADKITTSMFGTILESYRKIGEGAFETAQRIATEVGASTKLLTTAGSNFAGAYDKIKVAETIVNAFGSLSNLSNAVSNFYDSYFTDAEKQADRGKMLSKYFKSLNITMPQSNKEFKNLVESIDVTTTKGALLYKSLMDVSGSFKQFGDVVAKTNSDIKTIHDNLLKSWLDILDSAGKKILDTSTNLRNAAGVKQSVSDFYASMKETKGYLSNGNYKDFSTSLDKTSSLTSTLKDSSNFKSYKDMQFAQLIAANQFDNLGTQVKSEKNIMEDIAKNTSDLYQAQLDNNKVQEAQANEILAMRKEIQDQGDYLASIEEKIA